MTIALLLSMLTFTASLAGATINTFKLGWPFVIAGIVMGALVGSVLAVISFKSSTWMHDRFGIDSREPTKTQAFWSFIWHLVGWAWAVMAGFAGFGLTTLVNHWLTQIITPG